MACVEGQPAVVDLPRRRTPGESDLEPVSIDTALLAGELGVDVIEVCLQVRYIQRPGLASPKAELPGHGRSLGNFAEVHTFGRRDGHDGKHVGLDGHGARRGVRAPQHLPPNTPRRSFGHRGLTSPVVAGDSDDPGLWYLDGGLPVGEEPGHNDLANVHCSDSFAPSHSSKAA